MRKKHFYSIMAALSITTMMTAGSAAVNAEETENNDTKIEAAESDEKTTESSAENMKSEGIDEEAEDSTTMEVTTIELSDEEIKVNGETISDDSSEAVYAGKDIIYYKEGQDATYGAGDDSDAHSEEEAAEHTVITITKPGTYRVSGNLSKGQIAVDLGEDAESSEEACVNLILDNAEITCTVAPAIVVYHAYECGSDDVETASKDVDTFNAGFKLILAENSKNTVNGSYVAKIYKEGTTQEEVDSGEAKKAYKFDAAIDSLVSYNIDAEGDGSGKLIVNAENEGIETALHLTINGGEIEIHSSDDAINANEDEVSVLTINDGTITCDAGNGSEGDGIDSNGWIVMNGGYVIAGANGNSADSGVDSDMGIYLNGGTLLASGNMYDEISKDSEQTFVVMNFKDKMDAEQTLLLKDSEENQVTAFCALNDYQTLVFSSPDLNEGDYTLYKVDSVTGELSGTIYTDISETEGETSLQYTGNSMMGGGMPGTGERPEMPEGIEAGEHSEMPEGAEAGERPEMPEGAEAGERPEMPEGVEVGEGPEMPGNEDKSSSGSEGSQEASTVFAITAGSNFFSQITEN